jgi:hypothetical protein
MQYVPVLASIVFGIIAVLMLLGLAVAPLVMIFMAVSGAWRG